MIDRQEQSERPLAGGTADTGPGEVEVAAAAAGATAGSPAGRRHRGGGTAGSAGGGVGWLMAPLSGPPEVSATATPADPFGVAT